MSGFLSKKIRMRLGSTARLARGGVRKGWSTSKPSDVEDLKEKRIDELCRLWANIKRKKRDALIDVGFSPEDAMNIVCRDSICSDGFLDLDLFVIDEDEYV